MADLDLGTVIVSGCLQAVQKLDEAGVRAEARYEALKKLAHRLDLKEMPRAGDARVFKATLRDG